MRPQATPIATLAYGRSETLRRRLFALSTRRAAALILLTSSIYLGAYLQVRQSHAIYWRRWITHFYQPSRIDTCLYVAFRPACVIDEVLTGREFAWDEW